MRRLLKKSLIAATFIFLIIALIFCSKEDDRVKAHMTIYLAGPLLAKGGTVIVVANPIPVQQWKNLPSGPNSTKDDPSYLKRRLETMHPDDRLFGVVARTQVSIVKFVYPEDGTFSFNFLPLAGEGKDSVTSREVSFGSRTKGENDQSEEAWHYFSAVEIQGPESSDADSRGIVSYVGRLMELHPAETQYEGSVLYSLSSEQIDKVVPPGESRP
ncbi:MULTISPECIES: hypothetical protein [Rhizobium/Agrobacterium group]|uniref:hypothetical protein n=1 Tax=Rhizobium/Agrobacterium group TaxID=227290 RepID=UPI000B3FC0CB|nr:MULTISPECIES: hypothetical protein [Rhizobium/Agrobacterium group]NSZ46106.1 hypothetical protein [Agrobacterium vitis]NTA29854.1 hypothetical protein [Allorhizobium ampelinum]OVE87870.1 hypothetical protein B7W85_25750 [Allorhizobium ampelinum]